MDLCVLKKTLVNAVKPFILNPSPKEEKRRVWQTVVHTIFLHEQICGCQTKQEPCFLDCSITEQDRLLPDAHILSYHSFCWIIDRAQSKLVIELLSQTPIVTA